MNHTQFIPAALLLAITICSASAQVTIQHFSSGGEGGLGLVSNGSSWVPGEWTFESGVFSAGFAPATDNLGAWNSAWTSTYVSESHTGSSEWWDDSGVFYYYGEGGYLTNNAPFTLGTQLYVWGYNTKDLTDIDAEWILLTNESWTVVSTAFLNTQYLDTKDLGTVAILGAITNDGYDLQSASVSSVPEPAAYATLLGAAVLTLTHLRRRHRHDDSACL